MFDMRSSKGCNEWRHIFPVHREENRSSWLMLVCKTELSDNDAYISGRW
jgi:hypothetical protein